MGLLQFKRTRFGLQKFNGLNNGNIKMKIQVKYNWGIHYSEYEKSDFFCNQCGSKEVWEEQSEGDYYMGSTVFCSKCGAKGATGSLMLGGTSDVFDKQVLDQLRNGEKQNDSKD